MSKMPEVGIQVERWGNSLAVRLPAAIVEALDLKEGDHVTIGVAMNRELEISRDMNREHALGKLRKLRRPFQSDFSFDRDEANAR